MKKLLLSALLLLQASCIPVSVAGEMSACPAEGLQSLTFFAGKPGENKVIAPETQDGKMTWVFPKDSDIYVTCHYTGGYDRVQMMPQEMRSCAFSGKGSASCKSTI